MAIINTNCTYFHSIFLAHQLLPLLVQIAHNDSTPTAKGDEVLARDESSTGNSIYLSTLFLVPANDNHSGTDLHTVVVGILTKELSCLSNVDWYLIQQPEDRNCILILQNNYTPVCLLRFDLYVPEYFLGDELRISGASRTKDDDMVCHRRDLVSSTAHYVLAKKLIALKYGRQIQ